MSLGFLIAISLGLGVAAWLGFLWSVRSGQYDDPEGPKYRMLEDEDEKSRKGRGANRMDDPGDRSVNDCGCRVAGPLSGAKSLIVRDVQLSRRTGAAALVALLASMSPVLARAAEETTEKTTVILVDRTPKQPWETPAWAYPERGLTFFPEGPGKGKDRWAVGGLWQIAPMFTASYMRGLGAGFSVDARLQTIIIYNQLGVGGQWATMVGPFSLGVMAHVNGFFGALGKALVATTSFDTTGWGILLDPGAKAGIQVAKDSWLTLQYEAYLSLYQSTKLGTLTISDGSASLLGVRTDAGHGVLARRRRGSSTTACASTTPRRTIPSSSMSRRAVRPRRSARRRSGTSGSWLAMRSNRRILVAGPRGPDHRGLHVAAERAAAAHVPRRRARRAVDAPSQSVVAPEGARRRLRHLEPLRIERGRPRQPVGRRESGNGDEGLGLHPRRGAPGLRHHATGLLPGHHRRDAASRVWSSRATGDTSTNRNPARPAPGSSGSSCRPRRSSTTCATRRPGIPPARRETRVRLPPSTPPSRAPPATA